MADQKTVVEQLTEASAALGTVQAAFDAFKSAADANQAKAVADIAALTKAQAESVAAIAAKDAEIVALKATADSAKKQADELTAQTAALQAKLADPGLLAAAATGEKPVPVTGNIEGAAVSAEALKAEYAKETDPVKRAVIREKLVKLNK